MATYVPTARSNYFAVKDPAAFESFCSKWSLRLIRKDDREGQPTLFGFLVDSDNGIPSTYWDPDKEDDVESDFIGELSSHLVDGWVAIVREIGYEKMRYLVGFTVAVNSAGERIDLNLDRIYDDAERLGKHVTQCEY